MGDSIVDTSQICYQQACKPYLPEVLHGVLYPEAHSNRIQKKKKKKKPTPTNIPPSRGISRSVSPSQPDSHAKRLKTSPTTYATPFQSPLGQPSTLSPRTNPPTAPPIRRSSSLPLTTIEDTDKPFDVDVPPEHDTYSVITTEFIRSMYIWDDPGTTQPED